MYLLPSIPAIQIHERSSEKADKAKHQHTLSTPAGHEAHETHPFFLSATAPAGLELNLSLANFTNSAASLKTLSSSGSPGYAQQLSLYQHDVKLPSQA